MKVPQIVFDYTQKALERNIRTCLTCMHYRLRSSDGCLVCDLRPNIRDVADAFDVNKAATVHRRGHDCKHWEPDDE